MQGHGLHFPWYLLHLQSPPSPEIVVDYESPGLPSIAVILSEPKNRLAIELAHMNQGERFEKSHPWSRYQLEMYDHLRDGWLP